MSVVNAKTGGKMRGVRKILYAAVCIFVGLLYLTMPKHPSDAPPRHGVANVRRNVDTRVSSSGGPCGAVPCDESAPKMTAPAAASAAAAKAPTEPVAVDSSDWKHNLKEVISVLEYWRPQGSAANKAAGTLLRKQQKPTQYLTFETDSGGFNNVRMGVEFVVGAVLGTGRTLVLPPKEGWYLLDWGPTAAKGETYEDQKWLEGQTRSQSTDFWDIEDLR